MQDFRGFPYVTIKQKDSEEITVEEYRPRDRFGDDVEPLSILLMSIEEQQAVIGNGEMTQEIFNSIQNRRTLYGPVFEKVSNNLFFQYPEFARQYGLELEKLERLEELENEGKSDTDHIKYNISSHKYADDEPLDIMIMAIVSREIKNIIADIQSELQQSEGMNYICKDDTAISADVEAVKKWFLVYERVLKKKYDIPDWTE